MFKDKAGLSVESGDYIVYGHALGRSAGLRYGKVLEVVPNNSGQYVMRTGDQDFKLKVIGANDDWIKCSLLSKPSYVSFGSRVLKIQHNQMPAEVHRMLSAYQDPKKIKDEQKEET